MMIRYALLPALLVLIAVLHFGCDADSGGIGGSGVNGASEGTVEAYGSIWVNGVRWHIDEAELDLDDALDAPGEIELGMVVRVYGDVDPATSEGTATQVIQDFAMRGPLASIDVTTPGETTLSVLGQTAQLDAATRFDPDAPGLTVASLAVGDHVSLSGHREADGTLRVTYLERGVATEAEIDGVVAAYDGFETFKIGEVTVRIDGATSYLDLPWGVLNGVPVEVEGVATAPLTLLADVIRLDLESLSSNLAANLPSFAVQGYLHEYGGPSDIRIGPHRIDASQATFEGGDLQDLIAGRRVRASGERVGRTLVAETIVFDDDDSEDEEDDQS